MKHLKFLLIVVYTTAICIAGYAQKKVSLLVAEYDENTSSNNLQYVYKYVFVDGAFISKEQIVAVPLQKEGTKGNYVRFDIGKNKIYRNRYIVTGIGNIIDIQEKKTYDHQAPFALFSGDSVVYYTNDILKGKYYSIFNLKTKKYQTVQGTKYNPLEIHDIDVDVLKKPFVISYYDVSGKPTVLVSDAGYGEANPASAEKAKQISPLLWLDKNNFLYANFSKNHKSLTIYKVGIDKRVEKVAFIDSIPESKANTFFAQSICSLSINITLDLVLIQYTPIKTSRDHLRSGV